jgi:hypothetical protein
MLKPHTVQTYWASGIGHHLLKISLKKSRISSRNGGERVFLQKSRGSEGGEKPGDAGIRLLKKAYSDSAPSPTYEGARAWQE